MQNAKCKIGGFQFCILHFAFCIPLRETFKIATFASLQTELSLFHLLKQRKVRTAQSNTPVKSRVLRRQEQTVPQKITVLP
jgi:hypothetical protein